MNESESGQDNNTVYGALSMAWQKIPRDFIIAFFTTFSVGLATHLFVYMNTFFLGDAIRYYEDVEGGLYGGRWLAYLLTKLTDHIQMNWAIALIELFFLSLTAFLLYRFFDLQSLVSKLLLASIVVTFPTITANHAYMSSAGAYAFALLTAVLAGFCLEKIQLKWLGLLVSSVLIMLSMSTYPPYLCFAAGLMLLSLIRMLLTGVATEKEVIFAAIRRLTGLILGGGLYLMVSAILAASAGTEVYVRSVSGDSYLFQSIGNFFLSVRTTIAHTLRYYFMPGYRNAQLPTTVLYWIFAVLGVLLVCLIIWKKKLYSKIGSMLMLLLFTVLFPISLNAFYLFVDTINQVHILMMCSFVLPIVFVVYLLDYTVTSGLFRFGFQTISTATATLATWTLVICLTLYIGGNWKLANATYMGMSQAYERSVHLANRVAMAMESADGYDIKKPVLFVGSFGGDNYPIHRKGFDHTRYLAAAGYQLAFEIPPYLPWVLQEQIGIYVRQLEPQEILAFEGDEYIAAMPCFPQQGYVQEIDGVIVVKLSEGMLY